MSRRVALGVCALALALATVASGSTFDSTARTAVADDWPTYHRDLSRAGAAPSGPALGKAKRLWATSVDGDVQAEPLVAGDRLVVATENDSVYALAASTGRRLWSVHLGTPVSGGSLPCGNIDPSGITGTPVIDPAAGTVYVVAFVRGPQHVLVALDLASGKTKWQRPIDAPGADPSTHQQRAALALVSGRVYVAYGGLYGDCGDYRGRVVSVPSGGATGSLTTYVVPTKREGGIWAPSGPAVDASGNLYVAAGNGSSSSFDYGNAVVRLSPGLTPTGFFAPRRAGELNTSDTDVGSVGPLLVPGGRVFQGGKSGTVYLLSATKLGAIGHPLAELGVGSGIFGGVAYGSGTVYVPAGGIVAVHVGGDRLVRGWSQSAATKPPILAGPGLWAIGGDSLYQLDPATGSVRAHLPIGSSTDFATPAAAGGRVFVAAGRRVLAFA